MINNRNAKSLYVMDGVHNPMLVKLTRLRTPGANHIDLFEQERTAFTFQKDDPSLAATFKKNFSQAIKEIPEEKEGAVLILIVEWNLGYSGQDKNIFNELYEHIQKTLKENPKVVDDIIFINGTGEGSETAKYICASIEEATKCMHLNKPEATQALKKFLEKNGIARAATPRPQTPNRPESPSTPRTPRTPRTSRSARAGTPQSPETSRSARAGTPQSPETPRSARAGTPQTPETPTRNLNSPVMFSRMLPSNIPTFHNSIPSSRRDLQEEFMFNLPSSQSNSSLSSSLSSNSLSSSFSTNSFSDIEMSTENVTSTQTNSTQANSTPTDMELDDGIPESLVRRKTGR